MELGAQFRIARQQREKTYAAKQISKQTKDASGFLLKDS